MITGFRKVSPIRESVVLHIASLSRNVNEGHLKEIFSMFFFLLFPIPLRVQISVA